MLTNGWDRFPAFWQVSLQARLTEHRAVAVVGPIVEGLDDLKACGSKLFDQEFLRHAVATPVLRNAVGRIGG